MIFTQNKISFFIFGGWKEINSLFWKLVNKKKDPSISPAFSLQAEPQGSQIINGGKFLL